VVLVSRFKDTTSDGVAYVMNGVRAVNFDNDPG
jgi:hypothetical protein